MTIAQYVPYIILNSLDYIAIGIFLLITITIIILYSNKNKTLDSYFKADGNLSWFVAGTAMVATTFAADTPLAVTELVASKGISGNWVWWYMSIGSVVTVFVFAPLWKRSGVLTDLEFLSLRYRGRGADILRGGKALYLGGFMNVIIIAWVNLAMLKILESIFPSDLASLLLVLLFGFALIYTGILGLGGISIIDVFQFFFAFGGCIFLAYSSLDLPEIGGLSGLKSKLPESKLNFFPTLNDWDTFLIMITILWWTSWYPGSEPGGGGYIAQRILASKNEVDASKASLWFSFAHYFLRPWPWIIVALVSLIVFPDLSSAEQGKGFVFMIEKSLGSGGKGILIASFLAAYLSTIATHLNWGASYLVNDLAKPYLFRNLLESRYLYISYLIQIITGAISIFICFYAMERVSSAWFFIIEASSGIGFALVFRWFWWRIHSWSELTGFIASPIVFILIKYGSDLAFPYSALAGALITICIVLIVTLAFPEKDTSYLKEFYSRVRPSGLGWKFWARSMGLNLGYKNTDINNLNQESQYDTSSNEDIKEVPDLNPSYIIYLCVLSLCCIFSGLGGIGRLLFGEPWEFILYGFVFIVSSFLLVRSISVIYK